MTKFFKFTWLEYCIQWFIKDLNGVANTSQNMKNTSFATCESHQGAKKVSFTACPNSKLYLACTSPKVISTSLKKIWWAGLITVPQFEFRQKNHCPSGKLRTEFTSPIVKSTSPRLSDTTFFACWSYWQWLLFPEPPISGATNGVETQTLSKFKQRELPPDRIKQI